MFKHARHGLTVPDGTRLYRSARSRSTERGGATGRRLTAGQPASAMRLTMPAPILLDHAPTAPSPVAGPGAGHGRPWRAGGARNPIVALHLRTAPARPAWRATAPAIALAVLLWPLSRLLDAVPPGVRGPVLVTLIGVAAWRCAAMADRRPLRPRRPANDNAFRPGLPPHARRW